MIYFTREEDNYFIEGFTEKGSHIYFVEIPEKKLNFYNKEHPVNKQDIIPTELVIYSNIRFSNIMIDDLDKSHLIKVIQLCNRNQQIVAYPLIGFDYEKLKLLLVKFTEKFNL